MSECKFMSVVYADLENSNRKVKVEKRFHDKDDQHTTGYDEALQ